VIKEVDEEEDNDDDGSIVFSQSSQETSSEGSGSDQDSEDNSSSRAGTRKRTKIVLQTNMLKNFKVKGFIKRIKIYDLTTCILMA